MIWSRRTVIPYVVAVAACALVGCSASAKKPTDAQVAENPTGMVEDRGPEDDFINQDVVTEAMPSVDSFQGQVAAGSGEVASDIANEVRRAIRDAERGDKAGAASRLEKLTDRKDGGFLAAYNLGIVRERQGLYDQAAKAYFAAIQNNADFSPALENLTRLYLRQGQSADAERIARRFIDERPDNLGHRTVLLLVNLERGRYEDVISTATQILRKDERHVGAMYAMAEANFELGRFELAKSIIESAVELQPDRAELFFTAGLIDVAQENTPGALANFRKAVELRAQYPEARNNLGVLYQEARDFNAAEEEFKSAIRDYPDYKEAYVNLGSAYKGNTKYKDAELAFKKAIQIDPNFAPAHFNLGILYMDGAVPGMDTITRHQKAIESLNAYKAAARGQLGSDDPVDRYIEKAKRTIEVERQKQEMMREAQREEE